MDLIETDYGREGTMYCEITNEEIDLLVEDEVDDDYIEKCIEEMNHLSKDLLLQICDAAKKYCLKIIELVGDDTDFPEVLNLDVNESTESNEMLNYFNVNCLTICEPEDSDKIGYRLDCSCDWEVEHGMEIDILDGKVVYLGTFEANSPWDEYSSDDEWNFVY